MDNSSKKFFVGGTLSSAFLLISTITVVGGQVGVGGPPPSATSPNTARQGGPTRGEIGTTSRVAILPEGTRQLQEGVFEVTDTRPIEVVARLLSQKLGVPISYEEGPWLSSGDVMRAADHPGNSTFAGANPRGPLIPRGGTVSVILPKNVRDVSPGSIIQAALDSHRLRRNPGDFKIVNFGEGEFSLVTDRSENETGTMVKRVSPLDSRVSFPEMDRTLGETLRLIAKSAGNAAGVSIFKLGIDNYYQRTTRVRLGANNQFARDVLAKALRRPGSPKFSWSLRFDPEGKVYAIYFVQVQRELSDAARGAVVQSLSWPK